MGAETGPPEVAQEQVAAGEGLTAIKWLLRKDPQPAPSHAAEVLLMCPRDAHAVLAFLNKTLGNSYTNLVVEEWNKRSLQPEDVVDGRSPRGVRIDDMVSGKQTMQTSLSTVTDQYTDLLAKKHVGTRGEEGTAAWLLAALDVGLVEIAGGKYHKDTKTQLEQFVADEPMIRSIEKAPSKKKEESGRKKAKKEGHPIDHVHPVKGEKRGTYDIEIEQAPILETLVSLVVNRVEGWRAAGSKGSPTPLTIQHIIRGDPGYGGSDHTDGLAVDLAHSESDVAGFIETLEDLPPGDSKRVFPDGKGSLHVSQAEGGGFNLGFPGSFFDLTVKESKGQLRSVQKKKEEAASDSDTELTAKGLLWGSSHILVSKATKNADGTWQWGDWDEKGKAESALKNNKLKTALGAMDD